MNPLLLITTTLAVAASGLAQDDMRDVVHLQNGREVRGRILQPFEPGQLTVRQGGRRVRVPRKQIKDVKLVRDLIQKYFALRKRMRGQERARWILVEWAESRQLTRLARLEAMLIVLDDKDNERAHEFLGHRKRKDVWQWRHDDRWYVLDDLRKLLVKSPIELEGERFNLRTNGDLECGIRALIDLERMAAWWYSEFGEALGLDEVLEPAQITIERDSTKFSRWGFQAVPYYTPDPHGDEARTFYSGAKPRRPQLLFFVGMQALLYRTMIGSVDPRNPRDRICPWLEIGLGMLAEQTFSGDAGEAEPADPRMQDLQSLQALGRNYRLTHLLHMPMYGGFYLMDDVSTAVNWSGAAMFVQYLLNKNNRPATRDSFLIYVNEALRERKGDSSSLFDKVMGQRVEDFETPFRAWLKKTAGI